jgi:hypothetical protein
VSAFAIVVRLELSELPFPISDIPEQHMVEKLGGAEVSCLLAWTKEPGRDIAGCPRE